MRMKMVTERQTLQDAAKEFLAYKRAQKFSKQTMRDYHKHLNRFIAHFSNFMNVNVLKAEILDYFANIPQTSPAQYNHPYQCLHALFAWCAKQDYLPYNPFDKLDLKKLKDDGNIQPTTIREIRTFLVEFKVGIRKSIFTRR